MSIWDTFRRPPAVEQKALDPSDTRREPAWFVAPGPATAGRFGVENRSAGTYQSGYGGENAIDWIHDCVRLIAETTSSADYHFEDGEKYLVRSAAEVKDSDVQAVAPEDLVNLLESPNPYMDYVDLIELTVIDLLLAGEFIWYTYKPGSADKPIALYRLNPAWIKVVPGEGELIKSYIYKAPQGKEVPLDPADIIHGRLPNPHDQHRGLSVIAAAPRVFDTELGLVESQAQYYEQGTKLSGVLSTASRVPGEVFSLIQRQFASLYSGKRNAYKVAVLEAGLQYTPIQPNASDAGYAELSKMSRDRIAHIFRVPLPLIGNMENANYKMSEAQRVFDTKTMRPLLDRLERIITKGLCSQWGVEFKIDYEYVMPDEDRLNLASTFASLPGVKLSEVRKQAGLEPLGDERDDIVLNLPSEEEPNRNLHTEAGRPPNGERVPAFPAAGQSLPSGAAAVKALTEIFVEDRLKSARVPAVDLGATQIEAELHAAAWELEQALADTFDQKALTVRAIKGHPAWKRFKERIDAALFSAAERLVGQAADHYELIGYPRGALDTRSIARELIERPEARGIPETIKDRVATAVADGVAKGLTPVEIVNGNAGVGYVGLRDVLRAWRDPDAISKIGLTEAVEYYNEGALRNAEATGYGRVLVSDGTDHDAECAAANGQVWSIEKARAHRTEHPRCRRHFIPVGAE